GAYQSHWSPEELCGARRVFRLARSSSAVQAAVVCSMFHTRDVTGDTSEALACFSRAAQEGRSPPPTRSAFAVADSRTTAMCAVAATLGAARLRLSPAAAACTQRETPTCARGGLRQRLVYRERLSRCRSHSSAPRCDRYAGRARADGDVGGVLGPGLHGNGRHRPALVVGDEGGLAVPSDRYPRPAVRVRADRDVGGVLGPGLYIDRRHGIVVGGDE